MGVRHALFPVPTLGAFSGCRLPDAILHGKRSYRPRSRAVQALATPELLSEAFQPASAGGCATGLRTRYSHVCDLVSASAPLSAGTAPDSVGTFARCHGSRLLPLRLLLAHSPAVCVFHIAGIAEGFHESCQDLMPLPVQALFLSRLSAFFVWRLLGLLRRRSGLHRAGAQ